MVDKCVSALQRSNRALFNKLRWHQLMFWSRGRKQKATVLQGCLLGFFRVNGLLLLSSAPSAADGEPAKGRQRTALHYSIIKFFTVTLVVLIPLCLYFDCDHRKRTVIGVCNTLSDCLNIISLIRCVIIGSVLQHQAHVMIQLSHLICFHSLKRTSCSHPF